jgi:soluble cytochrome b562
MIAKYHTLVESLIKSREKKTKELYSSGQLEEAKNSEKLLEDLRREQSQYEEMGGC